MLKKHINFFALITLYFAIAVLVYLAFLVYQNSYQQAQERSYYFSLNDFQNYIGRSVGFGKEYNKNFNFNLAINRHISPNIKTEIQEINAYNSKNEQIFHINYKAQNNDKLLWLELPITKLSFHSAETNKIGTIKIAFLKKDFNFINFAKLYQVPIALILIFGTVCIALASYFFKTKENTKYLYAIIILCQIFLLTYLSFALYNEHKIINQNYVEDILEFEANNISNLLSKGLPLKNYAQAASYYEKKYNDFPNLTSIKLISEQDSIIFSSLIDHNKTEAIYSKAIPEYDIHLEIGVNNQEILTQFFSTLADFLTVFIISLLFITEAILFLSLPKAQKEQYALSNKEEIMIPINYLRGAMSIFSYASALAISFLPLKMLDLVQSASASSSMFLSSLPTSFEYFASVIALIIAGKISDKHGWQRNFILGLAVFALGSLASAFANSPLTLVFARSLAGFGYAFTLFASNIFIYENTQAEKRAHAFAINSAGIYSGYIAGVCTGGLIITHFNSQAVFLFATFVTLLVIVYLCLFMSEYFIKNKVSIQEKQVQQKISLTKFIFNKKVFSSLFLLLLPMSIMQIGVLNFAIPITLTNLGFSFSSVARAITIYGIVQIYFAPAISKYLTHSSKRNYAIFSVSLLTFLSFGAIFINNYAVFFVIFMLGIAGAVIHPSISAYITNLDIAQSYGLSKTVGLQRIFDKLGQATGPILCGSLFSLMAINFALALLGLGFLACVSLFCINDRN